MWNYYHAIPINEKIVDDLQEMQVFIATDKVAGRVDIRHDHVIITCLVERLSAAPDGTTYQWSQHPHQVDAGTILEHREFQVTLPRRGQASVCWASEPRQFSVI